MTNETKALFDAMTEISETTVLEETKGFVAKTIDLRYRDFGKFATLAELATQITVNKYVVASGATKDDALRNLCAVAACGYGDPAKIARYNELSKANPPTWRKK